MTVYFTGFVIKIVISWYNKGYRYFIKLRFNKCAISIVDLAIWQAVLWEPTSLVPQYKIIRAGLKSRTLGLTCSCMHLNFEELNDSSFTRHWWLSFLVNKKPFNFFNMLSPSMNPFSLELCDDDGEVTLSLLLELFLLLLLFSLLLFLLLLVLFYY